MNNIRKKHNKSVRLIIISVFILLSGCHIDDKDPQHRLQWWIEGLTNPDKNQREVVVAIIDTRIDFSHPDISNSKKEEYILTNVHPINGEYKLHHGTAIAGIISATPHSADGALGVNPNAKILSIVATNDETSISCENMINAIEYAIKQNVDIINISCGITEDNIELHNVISKAYNQGIVIVACAGNLYNKPILFPAAYKEVLAVSSYDKKGNHLYSYSDQQTDSKILYLPGENLVTTDWKENDDYTEYTSVSGTSFSTPILSGIISSILQNHPKISNTDLYSYFEKYYGRSITKANIKDIYALK